MKLTTKKSKLIRGVISLVIALMAVGFATGCSKKLMPPEIEASSGSSGMDGGMSGSNFSSGIGESGVGGEGAASSGGDGSGMASGGGQDSGFNIQEQGESGSGGGFFVEENVGESGSGQAGSGQAGSGADFSAGEGQSFGGGENGSLPGNGSDGFFASEGSGGNGSGDNTFGSGSHSGPGAMGEGGSPLEHDKNHQPYHLGPDGVASSGSSSGGSFEGMSQQEARLADFRETDDLSDIHFAYDKYDLTEESKQVLRANADWLKQNPSARIEIQGHCDERGTNNYNLGLGERRALSTMKFLAALGVDSSRIFTISYGEEKPFCFDSNDACWEQNRRAHFMVAN